MKNSYSSKNKVKTVAMNFREIWLENRSLYMNVIFNIQIFNNQYKDFCSTAQR